MKYERPTEDIVTWFHIESKNKYTVIYEIINPSEATYGAPFDIKASLLEDELISEFKLNNEYSIYRGAEKIGTIKIKDFI